MDFIGFHRVRACIIFDGQTIFIVFKGSDSIGDWISNISKYTDSFVNVPAKPFLDKGNCVQIFYSCYSALKKDVRKKVSNFVNKNPNADIHITGHSLGGGMALLCCSDFFNNQLAGYQNIKSLITFSQPKIVNSKFKSRFNELTKGRLNYKRFVTATGRHNDFVTTQYVDMKHLNASEKLKCNTHKTRVEIHKIKQYVKSIQDYQEGA